MLKDSILHPNSEHINIQLRREYNVSIEAYLQELRALKYEKAENPLKYDSDLI